MRLLQIGYDPTVQQQKSLAMQISKLHSDRQITALENLHLPFRRRERAMLRFRRMHSLESSLQFTRVLSMRINFKLNCDTALNEWRSIIAS